MKGNFHVQFLGEGVAATSPPYPTLGWATTQVYPARITRNTGLRARHRITREARTVSGCVNSAFLNISQHFTSHLFRPWIPSSARGINGGSRPFTEVVFNELNYLCQ